MTKVRISDLPESPARTAVMEAERVGQEVLSDIPLNREAVVIFGLATMVSDLRKRVAELERKANLT